MKTDINCNQMRHGHLNTGMRLRPLYISPVNAVPHGGQIESLWEKRQGLGLGMESSMEPDTLCMPSEWCCAIELFGILLSEEIVTVRGNFIVYLRIEMNSCLHT